VSHSTDGGDRAGRTPLHYAALAGDIDLVRVLIRDHDVSARDRDGFTPLHFAAQGSHADVVVVLVAAGASVDAQDRWGDTPLSRAVFNSRGVGGTICALLAAGANADLQNLSGVSPRSLAEKIANYNVSQYFDEIRRL
jgi:uncharacterized protein